MQWSRQKVYCYHEQYALEWFITIASNKVIMFAKIYMAPIMHIVQLKTHQLSKLNESCEKILNNVRYHCCVRPSLFTANHEIDANRRRCDNQTEWSIKLEWVIMHRCWSVTTVNHFWDTVSCFQIFTLNINCSLISMILNQSEIAHCKFVSNTNVWLWFGQIMCWQ